MLVLSHQAIKHGERIKSITVRFEGIGKNKFGSRKKYIDKEFIVSADSLATLWQFKQEVARVVGLRPIDLKLSRSNGQ